MPRPKPFIDCTSRFLTLDTSFPCELPYLHDGDHRCTLKGEESRIVFHGNGYNVDAETAVKWKPLHDDYRYFESEADWLAADGRGRTRMNEPEEEKKADLRVVACNVMTATKIYPEGAKLYVVNPNRGNGGEHVEVYGRSRGGRWVHKWESTKRLGNFRFKTIPPEHPLYQSCQFFIATWLDERDLEMLRQASAQNPEGA